MCVEVLRELILDLAGKLLWGWRSPSCVSLEKCVAIYLIAALRIVAALLAERLWKELPFHLSWIIDVWFCQKHVGFPETALNRGNQLYRVLCLHKMPYTSIYESIRKKGNVDGKESQFWQLWGCIQKALSWNAVKPQIMDQCRDKSTTKNNLAWSNMFVESFLPSSPSRHSRPKSQETSHCENS